MSVHSKNLVRTAGIGLIAFVLAMLGVTGAFYTRAFSDPAQVTLQTDRVGLVMGPGNKVKLRGVEVGRVGSVERTAEGAEILLEIDRDQLDRIPENVEALIKASTVFGAKYVELVVPRSASASRLSSGDVIDARAVTTEVNTVFEGLDSLLRHVDVADLNTTLSVLARSLEGRGDTISGLAVQLDDYLTELEPLLPQLRRDLVEVARFARLASAISPALLRILENAAVTGETVAGSQQALHRLLVDLSILGKAGSRFVGLTDDDLVSLLRSLRPTTSTLRAYSSELPCFLKGLDKTQQIMTKTLGGLDAGLRARVSVRSELPPYRPGVDLPRLPIARGPGCAGLPTLPASHVPFPERGEPQ
jgi:phospholipid/cholesterol/gamma-HCH transport system substrate-binding protein